MMGLAAQDGGRAPTDVIGTSKSVVADKQEAG